LSRGSNKQSRLAAFDINEENLQRFFRRLQTRHNQK